MIDEPVVSVGVVNASSIKFLLDGRFEAKGQVVRGEQEVDCVEGCVKWSGNLYKELTFRPMDLNTRFSLYEVTIGINFHWERKETQVFTGELRLIVDDGKLCAINILPVEDYLTSVISSEMSASAPLEFLKAHAVISRSWLMAQMEKRAAVQASGEATAFFSFRKDDEHLIRWYDREDHTMFDVCADDHCQRYQGVTRAWSADVAKAVRETRGEVLEYEGEICDARFSKCCGGATEEFEACWEDVHKDYLVSKRDFLDKNDGEVDLPDLSDELEAEKWIMSTPKSFCNTTNKRVLAQILNRYDQETSDFYRWKVRYLQEEISELLSRKLKMELGDILDIVPVKRGKSGRIYLLTIVGSKRTFTIGKELEIRRALSESHLFSSAFVVRKVYDLDGKKRNEELTVPVAFEIYGAGWGHGVGLCQIGAAVMGDKGYGYDAILGHYYPGATTVRKY